jgi:pteridine reductase
MAHSTLKGRTALVTGASKRLGRAIALALADEGVHVVVHYRTSSEAAEEVCREIGRRGVRAWPIAANLGERGAPEALFSHALDVGKSIDILINSASVFSEARLDDVTAEEITSAFEVNTWAPLVLSRTFAGQGRRGTIVNLLDTKIEGYDRMHIAYILSKHGLAELTRMCALEFAPNVTVNAVAPGLILPPPGKDESHLEGLKHTVPLKRYGGPDDVVEAVLFLARSEFVTGQIIYVDGGYHLKGRCDGPNPD